MTTTILSTADEVIDALGGTAKAAQRCQKSPQAVSNWRKRAIPPEMFLIINDLLSSDGLTASPSAFKGMTQTEAA